MARRRNVKRTLFKFRPFSRKQAQVLTWWLPNSPVKDKQGIIADGSIRAGKTLSMSLSYVLWAMSNFDNQNFGMAGKTVGSFRRNVLALLKLMLVTRGYKIRDRRSDNLLEISKGKVTNYFYIFGGRDESSQDLVQGLTAAGFFFDEVALMPESFVNQAIGRLSVKGSKYWFNCNPAGPYHWFKLEWLDKIKEKNLIHLHFTMDDNPDLDEEIKERNRNTFTGAFYQRYILGLWVSAEGVIYDMFDKIKHVVKDIPKLVPSYNYVSVDYGTQNATVFLMWQKGSDGVWYCTKEYYYSGRENRKQKTDKEFADDMIEFIGNTPIKRIIVDPSAASFIAELKQRGLSIRKANNDVLDGIRSTSTALSREQIKIHAQCTNTIKEFHSYSWDEKASKKGEDKPIKENDHAMDALRYFVYTILSKSSGISFLK